MHAAELSLTTNRTVRFPSRNEKGLGVPVALRGPWLNIATTSVILEIKAVRWDSTAVAATAVAATLAMLLIQTDRKTLRILAGGLLTIACRVAGVGTILECLRRARRVVPCDAAH
jgi:hypothetical protein